MRFDAAGGVREQRLSENHSRVLTQKLVKQLVAAAQAIERKLRGTQDIEWLVSRDKVLIVQARPYIE